MKHAHGSVDHATRENLQEPKGSLCDLLDFAYLRKNTMKRVMVISILCVTGCGSGVPPQSLLTPQSPLPPQSPLSLRSPLVVGVYSGTTTGSATISGEGVFESTDPLEGPSARIVISESGFPVENGRELSDGLVINENVFDFALRAEVSLTVVGDSLIVSKRITGDGVEGFGQEIYVAMSGGRMSYSTDITFSFSENGSVITFSGTETGILSR